MSFYIGMFDAQSILPQVRGQHRAIYQTAADNHSNTDGNKSTDSTKTKKLRHLYRRMKRRFISTKRRFSKKNKNVLR